MTKSTRRQYLRSTAAATTGLGVVGTAGLASAHDYTVVSTRGHYNGDGSIKDGYSYTDYYTDGNVPGVDTGCVNDLTVHAHGYDNGKDAAYANFDEAYHNLTDDGYWGEVVGFSWDSDAPDKYSWNDWGGFGTGQEIAQKNGYALAQFALDFKWLCPDADLRLTCHSLGAQVVLNCLRVLDGNEYWEGENFQFDSVHLLGAAQDNEAPTDEWPDTYWPIINQTNSTFNYHSDEDSTLQNLYWPREADRALGETGYESGNTPASNYVENDVTSQVGENHSAYMDNVSDEIVYHMEYADYY